MNRRNPHFDGDLATLLESGQSIPRVPEVVHARFLARARATLAAVAALPPEPITVERRRGFVVVLAAALVLLIAAAGAVAALRSQAPRDLSLVRPSSPRVAPTLRVPAPDPPPKLVTVAPQSILTSRPQRPGRAATAHESYAAELYLLQRAQVAYTGRDFADALALVAEHSRRFPNGRLAEEREVLRVRSLARAGRADEARSAAAAFADRFPRSVMLPRLAGEPW
jgi:hypothetical protein